MMTALLGITGKAGSGKSTAAQVLIDAGWVRIKFADPLKDMLRAIGLTEDQIEGHLKEVPCDLLQGKTPRWAMQSLGTEWGRWCIGERFWMDIARRKIALAMAAGLNVVVDDVRFENEAHIIRELGGLVLGISRNVNVISGHVSENGTTVDMTHINNGTVAELRGFMEYVFLTATE